MKFIQGMKAALGQNQSNTTFKEYGALILHLHEDLR